MEELARRFGRLVALHRKSKRWTQDDLAEAAQVSTDMIAKIETGVTGARFGTIQRLANALEVDPSELFYSQIPRKGAYRGKRGEIAELLETLPDAELDWALELLSIGRRILERRKPATASKSSKKAARRVVTK
ncbi:MAG: helix-turn-helix transcriptional regulator [Proteobacteria bacterium]|nr:helix-turn-helix transcriptional regulator [Pseudomonadota bacterium]